MASACAWKERGNLKACARNELPAKPGKPEVCDEGNAILDKQLKTIFC